MIRAAPSLRWSAIALGLFLGGFHLFVLPPLGFFCGDQGAKFLQARAFAEHGPLQPNIEVGSRDVDPTYQFVDRALVARQGEIRRQGALSIACHPHHRTTRRVEISTCLLWDHRKRLVDLVDVWEAANRDDLFSVTSLKHYPYVANSDFHKPKHLYSWKTLLRCEKNWDAIARTLRSNVDVALTLYRNGSWAT